MTTASLIAIFSLFIAVIGVVILLSIRPQLYQWLLGIMVFATCHIKKPYYQEVFFEPYRGVDRGFGVTIPDYIFLGFFIYILLMNGKRLMDWWPSNMTLWLIVIGISAFSLLSSMQPYYGLFTLHKFIRGLILYWVMVNIIQNKKDVQVVLVAIGLAVIFQGSMVIYDKYITKMIVVRSIGSFPHPNSLAMYVNMIIPVILAVFISDVLPKKYNKWAVLVVFLGLCCVIFTKSRASLVIMLGALGMVTVMTVLPKPTTRGFGLVFIGCIGISIMGYFAAPRMIQRFERAPKESEETREFFNQAAHAMANDHVFGVGLNAYSWVLANTNYYWFVYPDVYDDDDIDLEKFRYGESGKSRLGTAHHIYYLMAAEIGWYGMWAFILFLLRFYWRNIRLYFSTNDPFYKAIFLGLLVGVFSLHLQGLFEWIFRQTQVFYLFFIFSGLMIAIERIRDQHPEQFNEGNTEAKSNLLNINPPKTIDPVQTIHCRKS